MSDELWELVERIRDAANEMTPPYESVFAEIVAGILRPTLDKQDQQKRIATGLNRRVKELMAEIERLRVERDGLQQKCKYQADRLDAILRHWQFGVQDIKGPWEVKMASLVGDVDGLNEQNETDEHYRREAKKLTPSPERLKRLVQRYPAQEEGE